MNRFFPCLVHVLGLVLGLSSPFSILHVSLRASQGSSTKPPSLFDVQARYTKREVMIPMRDGVKLYTAIYTPKPSRSHHPILLTRTPYGSDPYGPGRFPTCIGPSPLFANENYIVVSQDVRGRYRSQGDFVEARPMVPHGPKPSRQNNLNTSMAVRHRGSGSANTVSRRAHCARQLEEPQQNNLNCTGYFGAAPKGNVDESTDAFDTIEWLLKHVRNHNGRVGIWGISYPGFYAAAALVDSHPALKAVSPQAPMMDLWEGDDTYHRGAFMLAANFDFYRSFSNSRSEKPIQVGTQDGYRFHLELGPLSQIDARVFHGRQPIWQQALEHDCYDDYWMARNLRPHLRKIKPAVLIVGGWYDAENLFGSLECYTRIRTQSPDTSTYFVMGPWFHGQWASGEGRTMGIARFAENTAIRFEQWEWAFFNHYLKNGPDPWFPKVHTYDTGADVWRSFDTWPPRSVTPLTLHCAEQGTLHFAPEDKNGFQEFISDPATPVPFCNTITLGYNPDFMAEDQRFVAGRPDVLLFQTKILTSDVTLAGPLRAVLHVSTTGTDSDWIVKLIDVWPENAADPPGTPEDIHYAGCQMLVRGDVIRGKYRTSFTKPQPFTPGQVTEVAFTLPDVFHTFRKNHRIMIQIQCTWFPWVDRNPQSFCRIPEAKPEDFRKATQRVYFGPEHPSRIETNAFVQLEQPKEQGGTPFVERAD